MGIGVSIFLLAAGAILNWGVTADVEGVDLNVIGVILMVVGGFGLLLSLLWWTDWAPWRTRSERVDDTVTYARPEDEPVARQHSAASRRNW